MDVKGHLGETSDRNEEYIRQWRKCDLCYKVANNLTEVCSCVLWKTK